jgi:hypothetical protein
MINYNAIHQKWKQVSDDGEGATRKEQFKIEQRFGSECIGRGTK